MKKGIGLRDRGIFRIAVLLSLSVAALALLAAPLACCPPPTPTATPTPTPTPTPGVTPTATLPPAPGCVHFDPPPLGSTFNVGDTLAEAGVHLTFGPFQWGNGQWTSSGFAEIGSAGLAGGMGKELMVNNILVSFDFGVPISSLSLRFGEYGGNLNIEINGDFRNFANFADINGATIGGSTVTVTNGLGNDTGTLEVSGTIGAFSIGGQELWIDDVCP